MTKLSRRLPDPFIASPCKDDIEVVYEDSSLLVINKPSGLLSLSGKNPLNKDSVHHRLAQNYNDLSMVHRLDFGTSGLMVLALNKAVNAHLTKQFQNRKVVKTYQAILLGAMVSSKGIINAPIAKGEFPYQRVCFETGKAAHTAYQLLECFDDAVSGHRMSRVVFSPTTGRTHQLRVHSQYIGHPIIGCDLYSSVINGVSSERAFKRLCLHANHLAFEHPESAERLRFSLDVNFGT